MFPKDGKLNDLYQEKYKHFTVLADNARVYEKATPELEKNYVTIDDLIKIRDSMKTKITNKRQPEVDYKYVLLCLYTYLPPLRTNEWIHCHLLDDEPDNEFKDNYINTTTKKMHIRVSKTKEKFGERIFDVPDDLIDILQANKLKTGSDLILHKVHNVNQKNSENNIAHMFNTITGKQASIKMFRNSFVSQKIDEGLNGEQRKKLAYIMGHSVSTQMLIYTKFSKLVHN
jgi:hypothetical protein